MRSKKLTNLATLLAFLCILLLDSSLSHAQIVGDEEASRYSFNFTKIIPGMPENASLGAYGNTAVNTATGRPDISFNLYTVSYGGVNIPITISYDASGVKYSDIPSALGMKWNLGAGGSINRSINGIADDFFLLDNLD